MALSFWWGHARSDRDWMHLYGGGLGVCIPDEGPSAEGTNLVFSAEGCPAAYCRVQVNDVGEFSQSVAKVNLPLGGLVCRNLVPGCVVEERNCHWLDSQCLLKVLQGSGDIIGPAGQLYGGQWEFVPTLVCSGPHPGMDEYRSRPRKGWPTGAQIDSLSQMPMLLVLVGFKGSEDFPKQMRVSWSHLELELIICLPEWVKQGYLAFKYTVKHVLHRCINEDADHDGRSRISSYHLKTTLLHTLENNPPDRRRTSYQLMLELLHSFRDYLKVGTLPHYFLPKCDLLLNVSEDVRKCALDAVQSLLPNPIRYILESPATPAYIYGDIRPNALVSAFCELLSLPEDGKCLKDLRRLLYQLDTHRESLYRRQLDWDQNQNANLVVSWRPQLTSLTYLFRRY